MPQLSAVILTYNEEANIEACLESVSWCDEVLVVDSQSSDNTVLICRRRGARVIERPWNGINDQRQYAMEQAEHDWTLAVDADERVSPELRAEIEAVLGNGEPPATGFALPRHTFYLGRWIGHGGWYPDYKLRLFDRRQARYTGQDPHDHPTVDGPVAKLTGELQHYTYRDLAHQLKTIASFSTTRAEQMYAAGTRFRLYKLIGKPVVKFLETYLWKLGCLDGLPGLIISVSTAYYIFLIWAKLWEKGRQ